MMQPLRVSGNTPSCAGMDLAGGMEAYGSEAKATRRSAAR